MTDSIYLDMAEMIREGDLDDHLESLRIYIVQRQQEIAEPELEQIPDTRPRIGSTVRLHRIRPKYLVGKEVVVKRINQKSIVADIPDLPEFHTWAGRKKVRIPMTCIEVVR